MIPRSSFAFLFSAALLLAAQPAAAVVGGVDSRDRQGARAWTVRVETSRGELCSGAVIAPGKTVDVAAFCVEQGRWNGAREGQSTGGKFTTQSSLALGSVRAAGQYDKNQSEVWNQVAQVNAANKKGVPSGTLLATMDDAQIAQQRAQVASQLASAIERDRPLPRDLGHPWWP